MLLASLALIVGGSLVCAASSGLVPMVVGRVLEELELGAIPLGLSMMRDELTTARIRGGIAATSATIGIGGVLCMPISATVLAVAPWQVLFLFTAIVGVACPVAVALVGAASPTTNDVSALIRSLGLAVAAAVVTAVLASSTMVSAEQTYPTLAGFRFAYALTGRSRCWRS